MNNDSYFKDSGSDQLMQTGVVLINPKTGGVPALVGVEDHISFTI